MKTIESISLKNLKKFVRLTNERIKGQLSVKMTKNYNKQETLNEGRSKDEDDNMNFQKVEKSITETKMKTRRKASKSDSCQTTINWPRNNHNRKEKDHLTPLKTLQQTRTSYHTYTVEKKKAITMILGQLEKIPGNTKMQQL